MNNRAAKSSPDAVVTSLQNERVKAIRALDMRKERKATGQFVAEGTSVLVMAQQRGVVPDTVVRLAGNPDETEHARAFCAWAEGSGAHTLWVNQRVLGKLANRDNPQSLIGVFQQRWHTIPDRTGISPSGLWLALETIRDPGNLGTIIRTADAVGADGVILVGACCDPYARECVRATMGSIFSLPIVRTTHEDFFTWRNDWPGDMVATYLTGEDDFRGAKYRGPVLLAMGSEGPGLSAEMVTSANRVVRIPMAGELDSLNLSVATALMLYEIKRADL